ncbi:MAG TPA: hypothetical protein VIN72_08005 [Lutibacter sp.]
MTEYKNVEHTKPLELIFLWFSSVLIFIGLLKGIKILSNNSTITFFSALVIGIIYFILLKKKLIRKTDFKITSSKLEFEKTKIEFDLIKEYKIRWMRGAELKFNLKNGETIRLSSNDTICNSDKFVRLCQEIDSKLSKYNKNSIVRKKSFLETKYGYYFAIFMTVLFVIITIYKFVIKDDNNSMNILLIIVTLGTIWSGVKWTIKR